MIDSTAVRRSLLPAILVVPGLAGLGALVVSVLALLSPVWAALIFLAILTPLLALLSGNWVRFFSALMITAISLNLDKTFDHQGYVGGVSGFAISLVDIALAVVLVSVGVRAATARTLRVRWFLPTTLPALVLIGIMVFSTVVAADPSLSVFHHIEMTKLFVLYLFVANFVRSEADVRFLVRWLLVGVLIQGLIVILEYAQLFPSELRAALGFKNPLVIRQGPASMEVARPAGTIGHPNTLGAFLATALPVVTSQLLVPERVRRKRLALLVVAAGTTALATTLSRGAWLSFAVGAGILLVVAAGRSRRQGRTLTGAFATVFAVGIVVVTFSGLIGARIFEDDRGSIQNRMRLNELAMAMIRDNPAVGVGAHMFARAMVDYDEFHVGPQNVVHNVYLLRAAEGGIGALLAFLWLIGMTAREGFRALRSANPYLSVTAAGALGGLVGLWLQMLVEILVAGPPAQLSWLLTGLLAGINGLRPVSAPSVTDAARGNAE